MGNISYQIQKIHPSTYSLTLTKKRVILLDETYTEQFQIPFLDFLLSLKPMNILSLFVDCVTKKLEIQTIFEKKDEINSFFYLFKFYIDDKYNKNKIDDYYRHFDSMIPSQSTSFDEFNHVFKDYIKYLGREYSECKIEISVSNSGILQYTSKQYIREIENQIFDTVISDCIVIIKELYTQFKKNRSVFYDSCFNEVVRKNPKKKQSLDLQFKLFKPTSEKNNPKIDLILRKNPELNKPNIINFSGEPLVKYLLSYYRLKQELEWEIFCVQKGNVFYPREDSDGFYYTLQLDSHIQTNNNKCYLKINSYHNYTHSYNYFVLDINVPFVKQVHLTYICTSDVPELCFELKNLEDEKYLNQNIEFIPILNEDRIPCLMDTKLFYKYEIDNQLFYQKEEILNQIIKKIDVLKDLTENDLQQEYITDIINSEYTESDFKKDSNKIIKVNNRLLKNFHFTKTQSYFFHQLFHQYQKDIIVISESHQFVIPNTKEQENNELGRRTEWVVDRFLKNFIEFEKWYYTIDEEDPKKRVTDYPKYPFNSIPVSKTIWNNQSGESFKPYDFQINFRNVEYKIEVKSTRGDEENVFYISVKELEELVKDPDIYFILRLSFIQKYEMYFGIQFNDEFYGRFYKIKPDTIKLVKKKLPEWKEYYKTNTIRFTVDQFELIPDLYERESEPIVHPEPNILNSKYWAKYDEFVQNRYFNYLENIIDTYSVFPEVSKLKEEVSIMKLDKKFHVVENLIEVEFVLPDQVEDITFENDDTPASFY